MIVLRILAGLAGLFLVSLTCLSAVKTVVVPRAVPSRITRTWFITLRVILEKVAHERRDFLDRDRIMALYAPLGLVALPGIWVVMVVFGFTGMHWAIEDSSLREAFLTSGSSMLTLGVVFHRDLPSATLTFIEATLGLGLVALLISYLPSIYSSFSRRETAVALLEVRAGTPPSPGELLIRYNSIELLDQLDVELFPRWEQWFVEVEESQTSLAALSFFRSPQPHRSWVTAAGCVMDTGSIVLSAIDQPRSARAAICVRAGFLALRQVAEVFHLPYEHDPQPNDPISVSREEFDEMCDDLARGGVPIKADREQAWTDFAGWRVNYDQVLVLLAKLVLAPEAKWSSDRQGPRLTPRITNRKAKRQRELGRVL